MNVIAGNKYQDKNDGEIVEVLEVIDIRDDWYVMYNWFGLQICTLESFMQNFTTPEEYAKQEKEEEVTVLKSEYDSMYHQLYELQEEVNSLKEKVETIQNSSVEEYKNFYITYPMTWSIV